MSVLHERLLGAYLELLGKAILHARARAWSGESPEYIADLLDAIHNLPGLLTHWEECDESWLRTSLESFDSKWVRSPRDFSLCETLDSTIERLISEVNSMATAKEPSTIPPEVMADLEAVCGQSGIVRDPELSRRITERAEKARAENDRRFGVQDIGVAIIREIRDTE
jgi:hypothetical protein